MVHIDPVAQLWAADYSHLNSHAHKCHKSAARLTHLRHKNAKKLQGSTRHHFKHLANAGGVVYARNFASDTVNAGGFHFQ
jgi:DNA repair ATPase RecN